MYLHAYERKNSAVYVCARQPQWIQSVARQGTGGKKGRLFQSCGFAATEAFFEGFLGRLPSGPELRQLVLPLGSERPAPLPPVIADAVGSESRFLDQRQRPGGGRLVDTHELRQLRRGEVRRRIEYLKRRVLSGRHPVIPQRLGIENRGCPRRLAQRCTVARQGLQLHDGECTCIYICCQEPATAKAIDPGSSSRNDRSVTLTT